MDTTTKLKVGFAALMILSGIGVASYPVISNAVAQRHASEAIQNYDDTVKSMDTEKLDAAKEAARRYNQQLDSAVERDAAGEAEDTGTSYVDLVDVGESLGYITIPKIDVNLPIYEGTSDDVLQRGVGHLEGSSYPLGGESTHSVLTAHRGYYGAEMLRNVQQIQVGDKIQLTTPWETLIYRVSELKIIDPSDINAVLIQPGRDLLTLSTCHPYTRNSQRYLVIAEHDTAAADTTKEEDLQESAATWDETPRQVTVEDAGGSSIAEVAPQALTPLPGEGSAESEGSAISNTMIWLENNALWAGLVVIAAAVGIMVIWKKHRED